MRSPNLEVAAVNVTRHGAHSLAEQLRVSGVLDVFGGEVQAYVDSDGQHLDVDGYVVRVHAESDVASVNWSGVGCYFVVSEVDDEAAPELQQQQKLKLAEAHLPAFRGTAGRALSGAAKISVSAVAAGDDVSPETLLASAQFIVAELLSVLDMYIGSDLEREEDLQNEQVVFAQPPQLRASRKQRLCQPLCLPRCVCCPSPDLSAMADESESLAPL
eukprot:TRINITY_DN59503_c0_g1_i1.p1 TRINITY_DN59503_c0_g1~~TRINITY_DN59503_c0_g1_i1.p1  ORF type:complete len:235 (+),score=58.86 TRINITY_DN59503_c0_g1_i1:60-707(+)